VDHKKIRLSEISTTPGKELDKHKAKEEIGEMKEQLSELQQKLYAQGKYSLLVILQGMDASGKDGAIRQVFSGVNPAGCNVVSFKVPTEEERSHDFLWRIHKACPAKGMISIFNRSQYEDILVPYVNKLEERDIIETRFAAINAFEQLLVDSNTIILKCFLHVSEEAQMERINERKTDPFKMWKYAEGDIKDLHRRDEFIKVYEEIFDRCSEAAPWHIVPADKNWFKTHSILKLLLHELEKYKLEYPAGPAYPAG
jgi:PPK2 family polyphosphate:nucleotide phosphotransferase